MSIDAFALTLPLTKIDEERRLIFARAAHEVPDKSKEIMDYATAKGQFQSWSNGYAERTNGLSKGNVRAMHNKSHATGKVVDLNFNDQDKAFDVCMKIVDDGDWQKCLDGVYTGVSVGGGYLKKWKDGDLTRYTPIVRELSLVDDPCIPTAIFAELIKMNGEVEQIQLRGVVRTFADAWAARPVAPPSFADVWAARPKTFGELSKAFDESKHPRNKGEFASGAGTPKRNGPTFLTDDGKVDTAANQRSTQAPSSPRKVSGADAVSSKGSMDWNGKIGFVDHLPGYRAGAPAGAGPRKPMIHVETEPHAGAWSQPRAAGRGKPMIHVETEPHAGAWSRTAASAAGSEGASLADQVMARTATRFATRGRLGLGLGLAAAGAGAAYSYFHQPKPVTKLAKRASAPKNPLSRMVNA